MAEITITEILLEARQLLPDNPDSRFETEVLLCHLLDVSRSYLYAHANEIVSPNINIKFQQLIKRRSEGVPVAYLLGLKEFWSLELEVDEHTLIPRPETELLVQRVLETLPQDKNCLVADLGVGSGAVVIALAKERPNWQFYAGDISPNTLAVAKKNSDKYGITNIEFLISDWCDGLPTLAFDAIASNPPYIALQDPHLSALTFEPDIALVSGKDGLDAIRILIATAGQYLKTGGWLLLEHGHDQAGKVKEMFSNANYDSVESFSDINHILRVTQGRKIS
jgi:release factor glutamine methyltransferase